MRQSTGICLYVRKTGLFEMNCGRSRTRSCELHHRHHHHIVSISMPASASSRYVPIFARMQPPAVVVSRMLRTHFCTTRIFTAWLDAMQSNRRFCFFCFFFCYFCWMKCLFALYYIRDTIFIRFFFLLRAHNIESKYKRCPFFPHCFRFVTMEQWFCGMNDQTAVGSMMMHPEKKSNNITQTHTRLHPWIVYTTAVPFLIVSYRSVRLESSSNADTHFGIQKWRKAFLLGYSGVAPFLLRELVKRMNKYGGNNNNNKTWQKNELMPIMQGHAKWLCVRIDKVSVIYVSAGTRRQSFTTMFVLIFVGKIVYIEEM